MDERDALLQYIVNIDEDASASIINQQLTEVVNRLQDLKVSIQVDPSTVERLYSQLDDVMNRINLTRGGIDFNSVFNQLGSEQQAIIQKTIENYNALGLQFLELLLTRRVNWFPSLERFETLAEQSKP